MTLSPLAPAAFPDLPCIDGVEFGTAAAGVKYQDRADVMVAKLAPNTSVAGIFTTSSTRAACILDCQAKLGADMPHGAAIVVNSGNANAFTGRAGQDSVDRICAAAGAAFNVPPDCVFTSSTGVIGEVLPDDKITHSFDAVKNSLSPDAIQDAASAIMTTDTFAKGASATFELNGKTVSISGIAKGSGMIAPNMATMLVYVFTDAKIGQADLQELVSNTANQTFNRITVDSDTSTSDALICAATGASGVDVAGSSEFATALFDVFLDLSHQVVKDGEGATKFIEVNVTGAASDTDATKVAFAIADSPLVKTACAGQDPNWGRIVMAVGKSGAQADRDTLSISFGDVLVAENGWVAASYHEDAGVAQMKQQNIVINVDLGIGSAQATVWTCDLTHRYIEINADYRS